MVIFGGLEFVAAGGYLYHRHLKNKEKKEKEQKERSRTEAAQHEQQQAACAPRYPRRQYSQESRPHEQSDRHRERRRQRSLQSRPHRSSRPHRTEYNVKPEYYAPPTAATWHANHSYADLQQRPSYPHTPIRAPTPQRPSTQRPRPQPALEQPSPYLAPVTPAFQEPAHTGPYSTPSHQRYTASTPNLPLGYQSNTGLEDDIDQLSIAGLEVYDPHEPQSPRVRFELPAQDPSDPPPPYRP